MTDNIQHIPSRLKRKSVAPGITVWPYRYARCPFCKELNQEWDSSVKSGRDFDANSKCKHFIGIQENRFSFERRPESCVTDAYIMFGGVKFPRRISEYEGEEWDDGYLLNDLPKILFCRQSNGHRWNGERLSALLRVLTRENTLNKEFPNE